MLKEIVNIISNKPPPHHLQFTIYSLQFTIYSLQFTVYSLQFTVYSFQFTIYSLQLTPLIGDVRAVLNGCGADKEII